MMTRKQALYLRALAAMASASIMMLSSAGTHAQQPETNTPIKHVVVIFNENISFDHYFGTYPNAMNVEGEPIFEPAKNTPRDINNIDTEALLFNNPNFTNVLNSPNQSNPFRLDRSQAVSGDQVVRKPQHALAQGGDQQQLDEVVEGEPEEAVDVAPCKGPHRRPSGDRG